MFELLILEGPLAGQRLPVGALPAVIGRSPAADLPFPQDNFVSGRHASIQEDARGVLLNDLRSTNGTFLNGERIAQAVAVAGDVLKIGSMTMQVVEVRPSAYPLPVPPSVWGAEPTSQSPPFPVPATFIQPPAYPPTPPYTPPPAPAAAPAFSLPPMAIPAPPPPVFVPAAASPFEPGPFESGPFEGSPVLPPAIVLPTVPAPPPAAAAPSMVSGATTVLSALNFSSPLPSPAASQKVLADARQKNEAVLGILRDSGPLFCLLNAGADETIPAMLALADVNLAEHCLLESGAGAPPRWAPYLLPLTLEAPLLRLLVEKGWGKGWVSFFTSFAPFDELRGHFRKFLMVQVVDGADPYFRFYDPTVLREFLTAGSPAELTMFFGAVDDWLLEGASKVTLLKARNTVEGLVTNIVPLTEGPPSPGT